MKNKELVKLVRDYAMAHYESHKGWAEIYDKYSDEDLAKNIEENHITCRNSAIRSFTALAEYLKGDYR